MIRLVKLSIKQDQVQTFKALFNEHRKTIESFEGCIRLRLWQDQDQPSVFYTCSEWYDISSLESYRSSTFFQRVWKTVKPLFSDKAWAWNLNQIG